MSSQLQVSGEAKIRDIQGPVVANSGVITALDGAASQYVRGDGTLADFPTSSGGGSSVSYYLNSSVSQGTIGGVAYRELSKEPIIGAGTDITISANGYVASYITDANDPDVLSVPGGNFNCEFYFSVNNNTGNPTTYAELYKYDGTTFTLLGSSVAVPESLNQGTTIAPYYFAIPVATAALALTDRLAIRIYVSVDGRTVTLHTENSHLCQVVTTFSKGMVSLNNLTDQSQFITTGTSGTDFNIVSTGDTHTFNLPVASATNTGKLSSTDWSTFNNKVPYTGAISDVDLGAFDLIADNGIFNNVVTINATSNQARALYMVTGTAGSQYGSGTGVNLFSEATDNLSILFTTATTTKKAILNGANLTTAKTFTLPNASGTIALTSDLGAYLPLTGGTLTGGLSGTTATFSGLGTFYQLTMTGATAGRIFYAQTGGVISQSGNLNWNETNGMLGVGTPNPSAVITAFSTNAATQFKAAGTAPAFTFSQSLTTSTYACVFGLATSANHFITGTAAGDMAIANQSATAGAIVFGTGTAEKMRMSASGRLLVGTSVDSGALFQVAGAATFSSSVTAGGDITINKNNSTDAVLKVQQSTNFYASAINLVAANDGGAVYNYISSGTNGATPMWQIGGGASSNTMVMYTAGTERMRITASGNVGIGTSSPSTKLHITGNTSNAVAVQFNGGYSEQGGLGGDNSVVWLGAGGASFTNNGLFVSGSSSLLYFNTNGVERMRITSDARVLIGKTTINIDAADGFRFDENGAMFASISSGNETYYVRDITNSVYRFYVTSGGTINATNTTISAISDVRLKENITDLEIGLDAIMALRPRKFDWKKESGNDGKNVRGFIAQEFEQVFPDLIDESLNKSPEGEAYKQIRQDLIPILVKAIQEQQAQIEELKNK